MKKILPLALEMATKGFALLTSLILSYLLTVEDFGEYTYVRSFTLVAATLLLLGLQTANFKFVNVTSDFKNEYTAVSLVFIFCAGILSYFVLSHFEAKLFGSFQNNIAQPLKMLIILNMFVLFFVSYFKAIDRSIVGFSISFFIALGMNLILLIVLWIDVLTVGAVLYAFVLINFCAVVCLVMFMIRRLLKADSCYRKVSHQLKYWFTTSSTLWLSGFLPLFLLQGLVVVFGFFFNSASLGMLGIAVLVVSNLAMFKEVSISLFLPRLIRDFNQKGIVDYRLLGKCIVLGFAPVVFFLLITKLAQPSLMAYFPNKLSSETFIYLYVLGIGQALMSVYQPIFRLVSAVGFHIFVLYISLILLTILVSSYILFGYSQDSTLFVLSSATTSLLALLVSVYFLNFKMVVKND